MFIYPQDSWSSSSNLNVTIYIFQLDQAMKDLSCTSLAMSSSSSPTLRLCAVNLCGVNLQSTWSSWESSPWLYLFGLQGIQIDQIYLHLKYFNPVLSYFSISIYHDAYWVLMAVGITAALCLGLTLFSFQTKIDFTGEYDFHTSPK